MPDPKLKAAMEEIKAVLKKHDIAGLVVLSSQQGAEFLVEFETSWNAFATQAGGLRLRCKAADYPNKEAQKKALENSVGTVMGTIDVITQLRDSLTELMMGVAHSVEISHFTRDESKSYYISPDGRSITCNHCGRTSHNVNDVRTRYCAHCHKFHEI